MEPSHSAFSVRALSLDDDGNHNDYTLEDQLIFGRNVAQPQNVVKDAEDDRTDDRADDRSRAAREQRAADDHSGNRIQLVAVAVDMAALAYKRRVCCCLTNRRAALT